MTTTQTPEALRQQAAERDLSAAESFDRCDTDGCMSQWASGITAREYELKATLAENGAVTQTAAVFDLDGNLVPAVWVEGTYGWSWMLLDADGRRDPSLGKRGFFSPSQAAKDATRIANNAKKGFYEGLVEVEAVVDTRGGNIMAVHAGIFPATREITPASVIAVIDNGQEPIAEPETAPEPQEEPEPEPETMCACASFPGAEVTDPETGEKKIMCLSCFCVAKKIAAGGDSIDTAYGVRVAVGDTVERIDGATGTVYGIVRDRWNEANDQFWQETVIKVRWDARTHANGVTSPVMHWDVRVDLIDDRPSRKLAKVNGMAVNTGSTGGYTVLNPLGATVSVRTTKDAAVQDAQTRADLLGHSMTVEHNQGGRTEQIERVYPASDRLARL